MSTVARQRAIRRWLPGLLTPQLLLALVALVCMEWMKATALVRPNPLVTTPLVSGMALMRQATRLAVFQPPLWSRHLTHRQC